MTARRLFNVERLLTTKHLREWCRTLYMNCHFHAVCIAALLVLAGCAGSPSPEATISEKPTTEITTDSVTATTTTSSTPTTTTISQAKILDYQNLGNKTQQALREALENGSVTVTRSSLSGKLSPDKDGWYVRHQGELYEMSWEHQGLRGEYQLRNATKVNASEINDTTAVIEYRNLSANAQQMFDTVRVGGETETYGANAFPNQFQNNRYVKYQGEYYELRVVVGDYITYRLSLREVEPR